MRWKESAPGALSPSVESNADEADAEPVWAGVAGPAAARDGLVAAATAADTLAVPPRGGRAPPPPAGLAGFQGVEIPDGGLARPEPVPSNPIAFAPSSVAEGCGRVSPVSGTSGIGPPEPWL